MFSPNPLVVQADDFERAWFPGIAAQNPCHVYMICSRPRIAFDLDSFSFTDGMMTGRVTLQQPGTGDLEIWFTTKSDRIDTSKLASPYPHTQLHFLDDNGEFLTGIKSAAFLQIMAQGFQLQNQNNAQHLALEVLYVGQAYGTDGSRQATDRLMAHETLQKVYSEIIGREPHKEVWLALLSFQSPILMTSIDGRKGSTFQTTEDEDDAHRHQVTHTDVSWHQQINFAEASLIRYFQPRYNTEFKNTFPSPAHKTYAECYDLDLNAVSVELQTGETLLHFFNDNIPVDWCHIATFPLHSRKLRQDMFDWLFVD